MNRIKALPLAYVGDVTFGEIRENVRKKLGKHSEFKKNSFSKNTTDDFGFCYAYYDEDDKLEAVELFPEIEVEVDGSVVLPGDVSNAIEKLGPFVEEGSDMINVKKSIGIYAPGGKMEAILFGKKDYYLE